jgi:hypothetical protein
MTKALEGVKGQRHAPAALYPGKDPVPTVQEAWWAPGPIWAGAQNLAPTGIRSPDRPALSQSPYRLRYPAHIILREFYIAQVYAKHLMNYKLDYNSGP